MQMQPKIPMQHQGQEIQPQVQVWGRVQQGNASASYSTPPRVGTPTQATPRVILYVVHTVAMRARNARHIFRLKEGVDLATGAAITIDHSHPPTFAAKRSSGLSAET